MGKPEIPQGMRAVLLRAPPPKPTGPNFVGIFFTDEDTSNIGAGIGLTGTVDVLIAVERVQNAHIAVETTDDSPDWAGAYNFLELRGDTEYGPLTRCRQKGLTEYQFDAALRMLQLAFEGFAQQGLMQTFAKTVAAQQQAQQRSGVQLPVH